MKILTVEIRSPALKKGLVKSVTSKRNDRAHLEIKAHEPSKVALIDHNLCWALYQVHLSLATTNRRRSWRGTARCGAYGARQGGWRGHGRRICVRHEPGDTRAICTPACSWTNRHRSTGKFPRGSIGGGRHKTASGRLCIAERMESRAFESFPCSNWTVTYYSRLMCPFWGKGRGRKRQRVQGRSTKTRIIGTNEKQEKTKEKDTREKDKKARLRGKKAEKRVAELNRKEIRGSRYREKKRPMVD